MSDRRLWVYKCPYCKKDEAYNGLPGTGMTFRGSAKCDSCGESFSAIGQTPVSKNGPLLGEYVPQPWERFPQFESRMSNLDMGDLYITDDGDLGVSVYKKDNGEKLTFLNAIGTLAFAKWLEKKEHPDYAHKNVDRIIEEKLIKAAKAQLAEFPDPDYGVLYWHPENRVVHWVAGDGAGGWTEAEKRFDLPGVQKVVAADEYFPSRKESGWKRLYG